MGEVFNVSEQTLQFLYACVLGAFLGVFYDVFRVIRITFTHKKTAIFIEDIIFVVVYAISIFTLSSESADGRLRFFMYIGSFLGFFVYICTVGIVVVKTARVVVKVIYTVLKFIYRITIAPVVKIIALISQKIGKAFVKSISKFKRTSVNVKKSLKNCVDMMYNNHKSRSAKTKRKRKKGSARKNGKKQEKSKKTQRNRKYSR